MQTPPPGQPGYERSYSGPSPESAKASTGLDANVAAALSYIGIVGLIFFFLEKEHRFIRFHAMQSILYHVLWTVVMFALIIVSIIIAIISAAVASAGDAAGAVGLIVWLVSLLVWTVLPLGLLAGLIFAAVKAYQRQMFKIPIIGNMAEKIVNK